MDAEFKKKWIEALRSGEYRQGTHCLRSIENKYCCLGVACDLFYGTNKWIENKEEYLYEINNQKIFSYNLNQYIELSDKEMDDLMQLNDGGKTFEEIADYIEKEF